MGNAQDSNASNEPNSHGHQNTTTLDDPLPPPPNITIDETSELASPEILQQFYDLTPMVRTENFVLMYSSKRHGRNINFFHDRVVGRGPCFLLIRSTKSPHVFGCYASTSWVQTLDFVGDTNCFLFSFDPKLSKLHVYRPGNYNTNFQYFNHGSKYNKYNGLAMGGKIGYFSLCLGEDFDKGKTNPETMTFPNAPVLCDPSSCTDTPSMEGDVNFEVDQIEVIGYPLTKEDRVALEYAKQMREAKRDDDDEAITKNILTQGGVRKDEARGSVF